MLLFLVVCCYFPWVYGFGSGVFGNRLLLLLYYYYWGWAGWLFFLELRVFFGVCCEGILFGYKFRVGDGKQYCIWVYRAHGVYSKYYNTQINNEISQTNPKTNPQKNKTSPCASWIINKFGSFSELTWIA